jgi:hypothetical protein
MLHFLRDSDSCSCVGEMYETPDDFVDFEAAFARGREGESVMDDVGDVVDEAAEETAHAVDEATDALNEE